MLVRNFLFVLSFALIAICFSEKDEKENKFKGHHPPKGRPYPEKEEESCEKEKNACIQQRGSKDCFQFDSTVMAGTAEEAVINFADLSNSLDKKWVPSDKANANGKCNTNACKGCLQMLIDQLERDLPMSSEYSATRKSLTERKKSFNGQNYRTYCTNLQNVTQPIPPTSNVNTTDLANILTSVIGQSTCDSGKQNGNEKIIPRQKRAGGFTIGTVSTLNCNYRRGNNLNDGSNYVGLCNLCSAVRTLPSQYFPRYINELSCQSYDNKCLSGYGTCRERYRSVEVLINYGTDNNPQWAQYSVNTPVGCECQIQAGSALSNLASA